MSSPKLKWLSLAEVDEKVIEIFQELKILAGVILYPVGPQLAAQTDVIKTFLLTYPEFANLTIAEIRHAFYLNNQGEYGEVYRHYNKELNAEFIGDVLRAYVRHKKMLYRSKGREIKALFAAPALALPAITDQAYHDHLQQMYDLYLQGLDSLIFPSEGTYALLRRYGAISIKSRQHFQHLVLKTMSIREEYGRSTLANKDAKEREKILQVREVYALCRETGYLPRYEYRMVIYTLRKRLCFRFFETMKYFNIKDIFNEVTI